MSRSMLARTRMDRYSSPSRDRGPESRRVARKEIRRGGLPESHMPDRWWAQMETISCAEYGRDTGRDFVKAMRVAEYDYDLACEILLGVIPLEWQSRTWNEGLELHNYVVMMGSNSTGKTTDLSCKYAIAGFFRKWAPDWWDVYEMLHHGPLETHALQTKQKLDQFIEGHAREQAFRKGGHWDHRPALIAPFLHAQTFDRGKHEGFVFFDGSSQLIFRPTAFKAKGSDGTAPHFIGEDELRYEDNLDHVVNFVFLPRFIRAPGARLYLPGTPLEASVEMVSFYDRGRDPSQKDWYSIDANVEDDNKTIGRKELDLAERNLSKRAKTQALHGKAIQPMGAKFNYGAAVAMFRGTTEPKWLDDLDGARKRAEDRCPLCKERKENRHDTWSDKAIAHDEHMVVGFLDPASSAKGADAIAAIALDIEPFGDPDRGADVLYVEELEPGTRIQDVARHLVKMARVLRGPVGYDRKGPLGHAVKDQLVELDPEGEYVEIGWDTAEQKDEALDYTSGLIDGKYLTSPYHAVLRSQIVNYVRRDAKIATDFLMALVGAVSVAKPYLPDTIALLEGKRPEGNVAVEDETEAMYGGIVGMGDDLVAFDPYAGVEGAAT